MLPWPRLPSESLPSGMQRLIKPGRVSMASDRTLATIRLQPSIIRRCCFGLQVTFRNWSPKINQAATVARLVSLQKPDGGWALATLGDWQRSDGQPQDMQNSDGYGTGFVMVVLLRSGMLPTEEPLQRGLIWLKNHQRASGRWFTRSLNEDGMHYISHAGTAMAVMALSLCDAASATRSP